jgi:hypothetical protein
MAGNSISIRVIKNFSGPRAFLQSLPAEVQPAAVQAASEYLIGNDQRGLRHLSAYKYVSRKSAYGKTFFSAAQRRWFWANVKDGSIAFPIHYVRRGAVSAGWELQGAGNSEMRIVNRVKGVGYVMGNRTQANQPKLVGHRKVRDVIQSNFRGMIRAAQQAVNRILKGSK